MIPEHQRKCGVDEREAPWVTFIFEDEQPARLDKYLVTCLPELSRSRIQNLIKDGQVTVNAAAPHKAGQMLETGAKVQVNIPPPQPSQLIPEAIPLEIIFENNDLIVVNKPAGMVVHPAAGHSSGTLVHAALAHAPEMEGIGGEQRPGVVHRLDKNTSGLILLAKNDLTHRWLQDQFRTRKIQKTYLALVDGHPPTPAGRVEAPIGRDSRSRNKMAVVTSEKGRQAVSEYRTLASFRDHTLLEVHPITGRTHQIRLHLAFLGCPVAGDTVYGRRETSFPIQRHFLHAARLLVQLRGETDPRTFEAPLPPELQNIIDLLNQGVNNK
jgi:23S rRNA pseudouridine1911/1915/1917 synthase